MPLAPDDQIGLTGARFGGAPRRRKLRAEPGRRSGDAAGLPVTAPDSPVGITGARFAGAPEPTASSPGFVPGFDAELSPGPDAFGQELFTHDAPRPAAVPDPYAGYAIEPIRYSPDAPLYPEPEVEPVVDGADQPVAGHSGVRPYVLTGGRTRPRMELAIETLLSATRVGSVAEETRFAQVEHQQIRQLCLQPRSVAEVAALMSVPLGVARVLLADLAGMGGLVVHQTASTSGSAEPELALMQRVLLGLRRL